jgi:electron-transferring-flavoprotein dehydrogenase
MAAVRGVATGNLGIGKNGEPTESFQLGMELHAKYTIFAEGSRGSLGRQLIAHYKLDEGRDPQSYGIGIKELWEVAPDKAQPGLVVHTGGWPLDTSTYGGSFLYHLDNGQVELGFVVGLDYEQPVPEPVRGIPALEDPSRDPEDARGRQASSATVRARSPQAASSACRRRCSRAAPSSAARQAISTASRIKGSHAAIKTGMLAAEAAFDALVAGRQHDELVAYPEAFEKSWLHTELQRSRNFKQWFKKGFFVASLMTGIEQWLLPRLGIQSPPWTIHRSLPITST